ncbi:Pyrroline-5-carboxylate reductase [hydrothermal vent metagenome]|uniref:Pyrroline-5-carboxylate reductase n=1 Tax=hydrothermal vent metagenome TaxID=652676 RepID=A0A3B0WT03_9ZZZZ
MPKIGFIGGGNMAKSLIGGLINAGYSASDIMIAEPDEARRLALNEQYKINTSENNSDTLQCDIIVLAIKPQLLKTVCLQLEPDLRSHPDKLLFISIAAGVRSTDINRWLNGNQDKQSAIVRCMPNTPSLLQCGASGLFANDQVSNTQKTSAEDIMQAVGMVVWIETEDQLNAVTAVSGSGPAYFFLMMEAMQQAGETLGLSKEISQKLVLQTALGASRMATESEHSPAELRQMVTSKGGTTEQAILSFQNADYLQLVQNALQAANDRSISLADELGASE